MQTLETRDLSWERTKAELGPRQREVLEKIARMPFGLTAWELSEILHRLVHAVRPRLTELQKMRLITPDGVRWQPKTERHETVWRLNREAPEQIEMF